MKLAELLEAIGDRLLYHFTDIHGAWNILEDHQLKIGDESGSFSASGGGFVITQPRIGISLTRNKRLSNKDGPWQTNEFAYWGQVRIVLDANKLAQRNKIEPYNDIMHGIERKHNQAEELIRKKVVDIKGCVVSVDFNYKEYMRKNTDWESWASIPNEDQKIRYTQQAREEASMFIKFVKSLGYHLNIVNDF